MNYCGPVSSKSPAKYFQVEFMKTTDYFDITEYEFKHGRLLMYIYYPQVLDEPWNHPPLPYSYVVNKLIGSALPVLMIHETAHRLVVVSRLPSDYRIATRHQAMLVLGVDNRYVNSKAHIVRYAKGVL